LRGKNGQGFWVSSIRVIRQCWRRPSKADYYRLLSTNIPKVYSGKYLREAAACRGQWPLVNLTRVFLRKPNIWLLDEPTASMDRNLEQQVTQLFRNTLKAQDTLVLVTHKAEMLELIDRLIVIANHQVIMDGPKTKSCNNCKLRRGSTGARRVPGHLSAESGNMAKAAGNQSDHFGCLRCRRCDVKKTTLVSCLAGGI